MSYFVDKKVSGYITSEHKHYDVWDEVWLFGPAEEPHELKMKVPRTKGGHHLGTLEIARELEAMDIEPELIDEDYNICSIGWSDKHQKYYGWSHRAITGFSIGDKIFEADFGDGKTHFTKHGHVTIETKEQARQSAINFAEYIG